MARILILIGKHLSTAPRAQKEALALIRLGHDVRILGTWSDEETVINDQRLLQKQTNLRFKPALDYRPRRRITNFFCRLEHRLAKELYRIFRLVTPSLYGYAPRAILKAALKENVDLVVAHSETTMWVARVLKRKGYNVGVDMEDWFSRDGDPAPPHNTELELLEKELLCTSNYTSTTSHVLAEALAQEYGAPLPTTIYNTFPLGDREQLDSQYLDRVDRSIPSLHWFSQTIGAGRGLETLFQTLVSIEQPLELHLRGNPAQGYRESIQSLIEKIPQHHIFFHEIVPNDQLLSRIAEHDIGFALEEKSVLNHALTVSNKIFQYMLAGIGVIASDTPGQLEVMRPWCEELQCVGQNDVESLSKSIRFYLENPDALAHIKFLSLEAAKNQYHSGAQLDQYKALVERAISDTA